MGTPFMSEVKIISWNFPPQGWALCNGQLLPINQNQALFSLLGTTYGGNGQTTFGLPNLQGRAPIHVGRGFTQGEAGGEAAHTYSTRDADSSTHPRASSQTSNASPPAATNNVLADSNPASAYSQPVSLVAMDAGTVATVGGSQPHQNMQPYLVLNFVIALQGIFPSQN